MRDYSVSISKAFGIILMVLAHSRFSEYGNYWINMFHMPLFFFFAGYCFKDKYLSDLKTYSLNRIKGIYIPFVKWGLFFLLLHNVFFALSIYSAEYGYRGGGETEYTAKIMVVKAIHIVTRMTDNEPLLGGYWFLRSLFWGSFLGYFSIKYINNWYYRLAVLLLLTMGLSFFHLSFPYLRIGKTESYAAFFFVCGYELKPVLIKYTLPNRSIIAFTTVSIIMITIGMNYWQATTKTIEWFEVVPYAMTAILGTVSILFISRLIAKRENKFKDYMVYIGDNTLTILTWHFSCFKIVSLLIISIYNLPIARLGEHPTIEMYAAKGWFVVYLLAGVSFPIYLLRQIDYDNGQQK